MKFKASIVLSAFLITGSLMASGGGSSPKPLEGSYPIVLSHGLFGWGDSDGQGIISIAEYWGNMDGYLRSEGAAVYAPTKTATQSNEYRAQELKNKINYWMAANGYSKVHILGHSQGGLDSRYMVSNLGMSSKVSSLTTISTPHRGSPIADITKAILPDWLEGSVSAVLGVLVKVVYGGGEQNAIAALESLTSAGLAAFNQYTPNRSAVDYFSYGSHITLTDLIQHPLMGPLHPVCGAGGLFNGQGFKNDGLVPVSSMYWGTWKGGPDYAWYVTGVDHLQASNSLRSGSLWYDVEGFYLKMAKNAKASQ